MQYGLVFPNIDVHSVPDLAAEAEAAGWDGIFIPDAIAIDPRFNDGVPFEAHDPWIVLAAAAMRTRRIRLGTMITPLSRRRPWKVVRETVTLDHLSGGRLVLPVGLGALDDLGFGAVGEATDHRTRARLLDESLDILTGLWSGEPFSYTGEHYQIQEMALRPTPVQTPRIPIWVVGLWPSERSMRRVLRWDGLLPNVRTGEITPDDIRAMAAYIEEHRDRAVRATRPAARGPEPAPFDIVIEGSTPAGDREQAIAIVQPFVEAGITWWLDSFWSPPNDQDTIRERIAAGPPRG